MAMIEIPLWLYYAFCAISGSWFAILLMFLLYLLRQTYKR